MIAVVTAFIVSIVGVLDSRSEFDALVKFAGFLHKLALLVIASAIHFLVRLWWLMTGKVDKVVRQRRPFALGDGHGGGDDGHTDDGYTTDPEDDDDDDDAGADSDHHGDGDDDHGIGSGRIASSHRGWGGIVGREPQCVPSTPSLFGWSDDEDDLPDTAGAAGSSD